MNGTPQSNSETRFDISGLVARRRPLIVIVSVVVIVTFAIVFLGIVNGALHYDLSPLSFVIIGVLAVGAAVVLPQVASQLKPFPITIGLSKDSVSLYYSDGYAAKYRLGGVGGKTRIVLVQDWQRAFSKRSAETRFFLTGEPVSGSAWPRTSSLPLIPLPERAYLEIARRASEEGLQLDRSPKYAVGQVVGETLRFTELRPGKGSRLSG